MEPNLIKQMMRTKLFRTSHQAGNALIIISILCWVGVVFSAVVYTQGKDTPTRQDQPFTELEPSDADPILIQALGEEKDTSFQPTKNPLNEEILQKKSEDDIIVN